MEAEIRQALEIGMTRLLSKRTLESAVARGVEPTGDLEGHAQREILYVIAGESRFRIENAIYDATPGTVFLIDKWSPHKTGYLKSEHDLIHCWCALLPNTLSALFIRVVGNGRYNLVRRIMTLPQDVYTLLLRRWNKLDRINGATAQDESRLMRLPLQILLEELLEQAFAVEESLGKISESDKIISALAGYIEHVNGCGCDLGHLAKISGYSTYYISHRFQQLNGISIRDHINNTRMRYTEMALAQGMLQKEIAVELGFSQPSNFWLWLQKNRDRIPKKRK